MEIFFIFFSALVIAFGCKSYHLSPKMSSFQMYSSELLPICCFWLFLTTFVLHVLEWSVLVPKQWQAPLEVAFESYNIFRTKTLGCSGLISLIIKTSIVYVEKLPHFFATTFCSFYLIADGGVHQGKTTWGQICGISHFQKCAHQKFLGLKKIVLKSQVQI